MPIAGQSVAGWSSMMSTLMPEVSGASLGEVRRRREVTQAELARRMQVSQAAVSKIEKGKPTVTTVRRYVEALGGVLEMTAVFSDATVRLDL